MVPENELTLGQWGRRCPDHLLVACLGIPSQLHLALWNHPVEPGWEVNRKVSQRESKHSLPARGLVQLYVQETPCAWLSLTLRHGLLGRAGAAGVS